MGDFTDSVVNQRFKAIYDSLERTKKIKGKSDIAKHLDTYNHVINSILKGKRNITVEQLNKLFKIYNVNANYIFGLSDSMFMNADIPTLSIDTKVIGKRDNITLVPHRAVAGYALASQEELDTFQKFSLPEYEGELIAFEIDGDSMSPTITNGDIVVCEPIERTTPIRENSIYVVVSDSVVAKRIQPIKRQNEIVELRLLSDNDIYKPYTLDLHEVQQILKVKCRLTRSGIN